MAPESVRRLLDLLHAIDAAGADRKCRVGVNLTTKNPKPFVKVGGVRWSLDLFEEYDQVPHVLTADERRTKRLRPWAHIPEFDRVATGRLRLEAGKFQSDQRLTWRDTVTSTLEQQVRRIVADIIKAVEKQEGISAAFRQREKEWQAAARLESGGTPRTCGAFCDVLEHASAAGETAGNGELAAWLTWARARADKIDPTVGYAYAHR